jgi:hypothetical protein
MQAFHDTSDDCGLHDLGYVGDMFTWHRGLMWSRLDRAIGNSEWRQMHQNAALVHLEYNHSDHRPLLLDTEFYTPSSTASDNQHRFEAKWFREEGFSDIVKEEWESAASASDPNDVLARLKTMHAGLHAWDHRVLRRPKKRLRAAQRELEAVMRGPFTPNNEERKHELAMLIKKVLEQEEICWNQHSRANWLKNGDKNTAYFHSFATARRKRNFIKKLKNLSGNFVEGTDNLNPIILKYFSNLFSTENTAVDADFLEKVSPKVTEVMNNDLIAPFTPEDVKKAVFSIGDLKAPGPDGLHALFYKKFWHLVGQDITVVVLKAINEKEIPAGWNETVVVLIPKVDNPEEVSQFRPISLCNVVYKIISKMLAARLKVILPDIISPTQSSFVPRRLITDNVLVAYECVHKIKNKRKGKTRLCAVKLDMHKAYDRVEWDFLRRIMSRLGFHSQWIDLVKACVTSVSYSIRFNSQMTDSFVPIRGIRQGDPLSPYLFLLCVEGLSSCLKHVEEIGGIEGIKVCRGAPSVSHLLFADDSLILLKAELNNAISLQQVLDSYCANSGQLISVAKSSISFSPNTPVEVKVEICNTLNINTEALSNKYLGLLALVGADRSD